uniref:Disease resistance N-terminal domain-containing protein n=1 Tax=Populus trichocarpa TaxID=3694 RepID=A0A3N7GNX5_POPTR
MAERVLFNIAEEIVKKLGPLATQEIALWWGVKDQLSKLKSTVTRIKGVLHDAEEQVQKPPAQLEDWLGKLQEAVYDAEDLLDDFSTEVQRKRLMSRNKISREVQGGASPQLRMVESSMNTPVRINGQTFTSNLVWDSFKYKLFFNVQAI